MKSNKNYLIFWFTQMISQLGSSMTNYALIIWAYGQTGSAMSVSIMSFCTMVPYVLISALAGSFVDRHNKKLIMAVSDTVAAVCSVSVILALLSGHLVIGHIYVVNVLVGVTNAFQSPATSVAMGLMVKKEQLTKMSGMNAFSSNIVMVSAPMLAGAILGFGGMTAVITLDLCSFIFATTVLLFFIKIPENYNKNNNMNNKNKPFDGLMVGWKFVMEHKGIFYLIIIMSIVNLFSTFTYDNTLPVMILSRSGNNPMVYSIVSAIIGAGGIIGGMIVATGKIRIDKGYMICGLTAFSFIFGDVMMAVGRNVVAWSIAALVTSIPIPFITTGQNVIYYRDVPREIQGRVFAVSNAIQYCTRPLGLLAGGFLADYVFEPFMAGESTFANFMKYIVGSGPGSGIAIMFLCTGIGGFIIGTVGAMSKEIRKL